MLRCGEEIMSDENVLAAKIPDIRPVEVSGSFCAALPDIAALDEGGQPPQFPLFSTSPPRGDFARSTGSHGVGGDGEATCPFAALSALLAKDGGSHPTPAHARPTRIGDEFLEEADEIKPLPSHDSRPPGGIPVQCPMSGMFLGEKKSPDISRTRSFEPSEHRSTASFRQPSELGSRTAGTATDKRSATGSKRSHRKGGRPKVKRHKRLTGYSAWEAQNYIPVIQRSWAKVLQKHLPSTIGLSVYCAMFDSAPEFEQMYSKSREIMGAKFAEILQGMVDNVEDPTVLYEQLKALAPMHVERGVSQMHTPVMQQAILKVLARELGPEYTLEVKSAWEWMWTWVSETLLQTMEEVANDQTVISRSWDLALENYDELELAGLMYDVLFEIAPNLQHVYCKPRQVMAVKFMDLMSTLVSFHGDSARVEEQVRWLGVRHVQYKAKRQHVFVMQEVLLTTMARAVGSDDWSDEMEKAWTELWQVSCKRLFDVMEDAEQHGDRVRNLWERVQGKTNIAQFGWALRKAMLSGTEWVQTLATKTPDTADKPHHHHHSQDKETASEASGLSDKGEDADHIGTQFWNMLTVLLDLLWQPERQNEKLVVMATKFFECGIRIQHLETVGDAIFQTIRRVLTSDVSREDFEAWQWFWSLTTHTLTTTLTACEQNHAVLVRNSWESIKVGRPLEELGEHLFQGLATLAPHVIHIFKRPKKIQAMQFVNAVELLVSFNEDPEAFFEELKELTIRHIKYGVKPDYAKPYGKALLKGIAELVGDDFEGPVKHAWTCLWEKVANCVIRALSIGSNLVVMSLIQGDLEALREAMDCTPRGERFDTLTSVEVHGEESSPLRWAITDGKVQLAKFILEDLLTIRADRHAYYYGRETLFRTHPDVVKVLASEVPVLLETLFNGLTWHSHVVHDGRILVNYYIRELYGCPDEVENVWDTTLGVLSLKGDPRHFSHPVMVKLIEVKWNQFARGTCLCLQGLYVTHVALFFAGFVVHGGSCGAQARLLRYLTAGFAGLLIVASAWLMALQLQHGLVSTHEFAVGRRVPGLRRSVVLPIPRFLRNHWNVNRCICNVLILITALAPACSADKDPEQRGSVLVGGMRVASAVTAVLMGMQVLEVLILSKKLSAFMFTMMRLVEQLLVNVVVCIVGVFAFAGALVIIGDDFFETIEVAMLNMIKMTLGIVGPEILDGIGVQSSGFLLVFMMVVWIGFLNVLIAQFVFGYNAISAETEAYALMMRAQTCCEMESFLPHALRRRLFLAMQFDLPLHYDSAGDEGPPGGIQVLESASVKQSLHYVPDRVLRFTGEATAADPWPSLEEAGIVEEEEASPGQGGGDDKSVRA